MTGFNKLWIEFEAPKDLQHAKEQCRLVNAMMTKLADKEHLPLRYLFQAWENQHGKIEYTFGDAMGYVELPDRGHWLNLDYMGK